MGRTTFFFTIFGALFVTGAAWAQSGITRDTLTHDSLASSSFTVKPDQNAFHFGVRSEFGESHIPNFQDGMGLDLEFGKTVVQFDYRSYGGASRQPNTPPSAYYALIVGWAPNGSPTSTSIADLPNTIDGINEYSLSLGKLLKSGNGRFLLGYSIGLGAVSKSIVHYRNCQLVSQPGTGIVLIFPVADTQTYYQYNASVVDEVTLTVPVSVHFVAKITSWLGLSASAWGDIVNGTSYGWSAGLEVGSLP